MNIRTSLGKYACAASVLLAVLSGAGMVMGQQEIRLEQRTNSLDNVSLGSVQTVPGDGGLSSEEQGHTQMDGSFDFREWRLEKRRTAFEDTKFEFNLRTFFYDRNQFSGIEQEAWAVGGWVGLKTGYFLDHIAFGLTAYGSGPLYAPDDRDGTLLLKPGQQAYAALGEAYADIRIVDGLNLYVGRKGIDTPFINRNDNRMTPNTFELIVLQGRVEFDEPSTATAASSKDPVEPPKRDVPVLKYGIGYFDEIKERNADHFVPMSIDAGATVDRGVFAAGAVYEKGKFSLGAIDYYSQDIINIGYAEGKMELPFSADFRPTLAAQFVDQRSVGDDLLQGDSFFVQQFGIKAELPVKNALFTMAYTFTTNGDANLRAPWSGYPGYTSVQVQDFNRAGENAFLLRVGYEFPWVDGLSAYALGVFGTDPAAVGQFRQDEFDANLQWAPTKGVLKGLSLRLRYAVVDQHGGNVENLTDFRTICNYVIKF